MRCSSVCGCGVQMAGPWLAFIPRWTSTKTFRRHDANFWLSHLSVRLGWSGFSCVTHQRNNYDRKFGQLRPLPPSHSHIIFPQKLCFQLQLYFVMSAGNSIVHNVAKPIIFVLVGYCCSLQQTPHWHLNNGNPPTPSHPIPCVVPPPTALCFRSGDTFINDR